MDALTSFKASLNPVSLGAVWDFHILLVREGLTSDLPELHSTPWSSVQAADPSDRRVQDFHRARQEGKSSTVELDLDTLLSQKHSGECDIRKAGTSFLPPFHL